MGRTEKSKKNMIIALIGQVFVLLVSFITRSIFVRTLAAEYLGISGLFTNIVNVLSLAELGIGVAITYSLYKPIADNDQNSINAIMIYYKKVYQMIGFFILTTGFILSPFLDYFIKDNNTIPYLQAYFLLYVINTVITYFYTHKQSLIIAHQNNYIVSINRYTFVIIRNLTQIIMLISFKSFFAYLISQMIFTLMENIRISNIADKLYPHLNQKGNMNLDISTSQEIKKNTLAMVLHKVGSVVVNGTDNIIISKFVGLLSVGLYSNYWLIISSIHAVYNQGFLSLTASIGNLGVTESKEKSLDVFKKVYFVNYWIYSFSTVSLLILINPFISIWLSNEYLLPRSTIILLVVNFYLTGMRTGVNIFKNSFGLFWNDRYKPLIESIINITASLLLVRKWGIDGVLMGTIISTVTTSLWIEPYVLFKYGFEKKVTNYFKIYFKYILATICISAIVLCVSMNINQAQHIDFIIRVAICLTIPNFLITIAFFRTSEFRSISHIILSKYKKVSL